MRSDRGQARLDIAYAALLAVVAGFVYLVNLGIPAAPVWDESYYLTSAERSLAGTAQFASHPPLGPMLIAAGERALGDGTPHPAMGGGRSLRAGDLPSDFDFAAARFASGLFGVFGVLAFFALLRTLDIGRDAALAVSGLWLFDNASAVQFRAAQLDSFLLFFFVAALASAAVLLKKRSMVWCAAFGICAGLSTMVKLSGALVCVAGAAALLIELVRSPLRARDILAFAGDGAVITLAFAGTIGAVFALHVALSPNPPVAGTPAGDKDLSYLSPAYRAYLDGARPLGVEVLWLAAGDYIAAIRDDFAGMPKADPNGSTPLSWPFGGRTINFRWDSQGGETAYVQLAPNPVVWLLGLTGLICGLAAATCATDGTRRAQAMLLLITYAVFLAAHVVMGTHRVMYLYHYLPGLAVSLALLPVGFAALIPTMSRLRRHGGILLSASSLAGIATFLFFSPLTFHGSLTPEACELRNFLSHVVDCRP